MPKVRPETGALLFVSHFLPVHASTFAPAAPDRERRRAPCPVHLGSGETRDFRDPGRKVATYKARVPGERGRLSVSLCPACSQYTPTASFSAGEPRARTHTVFQSPISVPGPIFSELLSLDSLFTTISKHC
jgi:hypothetical protein